MKKRLLSILLVLTMLLSLIPAMSITAGAAETPVSYLKPVYVDENDVTKGISGMTTASCNSYTSVSPSDTTWGKESTTTWYIATGTVTIDHTVTVKGNVHLILADGCNLTVNVTSGNGITVGTDCSLTIYAQSEGNGMGSLTVTSAADSDSVGIGPSVEGEMGNLTVNGGKISVSNYATGLCGQSITVSGGDISINNSVSGIMAASVNIYGGNVDAFGSEQGIYAISFNMTGGDVTAKNSYETNNYEFYSGITCQNGNVTISGGSLNAIGTNFGIGAYSGNITISGDDTVVNASGGIAGIFSSYGTTTNYTMSIEGASVSSYGDFWAIFANTINVSKTNSESKGMFISAGEDAASAITVFADREDTTNLAPSNFNDNDMLAASLCGNKFVRIGTAVCYVDADSSGTLNDGDTEYGSVQAAVNAAGETTKTVRLIADDTENVTIPAGRNITIDLGGYVLSGTGTTSVITNHGTLYITDSDTSAQTHKVHNFKVGDNGLWTLTTDAKTVDFESLTARPENNAVVAVQGGCITGGYNDNGGGIYNNSDAVCNMTGGTVTGNSAPSIYGGGVYSKGTFTMTGGTITGNTADTGGGVCNDYGTFTMTGGTITGNTARMGGGVSNVGTATIGGTAKIYGNTAPLGDNLTVTAPFNLATGNDIPTEGMNVGVTLLGGLPFQPASGAFTTNGSESDKQYFFSDSDDYIVRYNNSGHLELIGSVAATTGTTTTHYTSIENALKHGGTDASNAPTDETAATPTVIKLLANSTENVTIPTGRNITLDLNGKVLKSAYENKKVIENNGTLTIKDSNTGNETHNFKVEADGLWMLTDKVSTKTYEALTTRPADGEVIAVPGGVITGSTKTNAVYNKNYLTIQSGNIIGCGRDSNGSALYCVNGVCTMTGGRIAGNPEGAVYVCDKSSFTLSEGCIEFNSIGILNSGKVLLSGGVIAYNSSSAGVGVNNDYGDFTMTGGTITGNTAEKMGGGVYNGSGTFTMTGGSITGNTAGAMGGGVLTAGTATIGGTAKIYGNTAPLGDNLTVAAPFNLATGTDIPKEGMNVGVTLLGGVYPNLVASAGKFTTNGASTDTQYFTSDNNAYYVKYDTANNYLVLDDVSNRPASPSGDSTPTVTVPVSGDKDTVKVSATVSGTNATIKNVTAAEIEKVGTGDTVVVDLTGLNKSVTGVTIPKTTFENMAASDAAGLEVKLPNGTIAVFDKTTLKAVASQAKGANIQLVVDRDSKAEQSMTKAQKEAVSEMNKPVVLDAYFVSNGVRISDFKGGEADIIATYETTNPVRVWYVTDDGTKELVPSTFDGKVASFTVKHFSHYVIEQLDGSSYDTCPQDSTCVYAKFSDANPKEWYHSGVHFCVENGYMNGVSATKFAPSGTLSRAMIVTMLWRMEGSPVVNYAMTFKDVATDQWYTEAIRWAQSTGVVTGYDDVSFGPEDNVTREQLAAILWRYAKLKGYDVSVGEDTNILSYDDAIGGISEYAISAMQWACGAGIINGIDNRLEARGFATRAQAACMIQRFCMNVAK